jgi:hypothetical protein
MHDFPDDDEDEELHLAIETMAMAEQLVRGASYLCIEPVDAPTTPQMLSVQAFFPHDDAHDLRRAIIAGLLRIGPFLPGPVLDFAQSSLRGAGLNWHTEPPNSQDLAKLGMDAR